MKILDGPMGTELIRRLGSRAVLDDYSVEEPGVVGDVYKDYIDSGCDIITSNTFNSHSVSLQSSTYSVEELNQSALQICKKFKKNHKVEIAFSIGGSRKSVSKGEVSSSEMTESYLEQLKYVDEAVDYVLLETVYDLGNALSFFKAWDKAKIGSKLIVSSCLDEKEVLIKIFNESVKSKSSYIGLNCIAHNSKTLSNLKFLLDEFPCQKIVYSPNSMGDEKLKNLPKFLSISGKCCGFIP